MTKPQAWITRGGPLYKLLIRINLYIMLALESELIDLTVMDKYQQNMGALFRVPTYAYYDITS